MFPVAFADARYLESNPASKRGLGFGGKLTLAPTTAFVPVLPAAKTVPKRYTALHGVNPGQFVVPSLEEKTYTLPAVESTIGPATSPVPKSTFPEAVATPVELTRYKNPP